MADCLYLWMTKRRDFFEDRYQLLPRFVTSQPASFPLHEQIGDPTLADGILDSAGAQCSPRRDARRFYAQESRKDKPIACSRMPKQCVPPA